MAWHGIDSRHGLIIDERHRNQPNKSKLALYKPLLHFYSQLYMSNKMEHFSYKCGCGVCWHTLIEVFKKKNWLGLQINSFGLMLLGHIMLFKTVIPLRS